MQAGPLFVRAHHESTWRHYSATASAAARAARHFACCPRRPSAGIVTHSHFKVIRRTPLAAAAPHDDSLHQAIRPRRVRSLGYETKAQSVARGIGIGGDDALRPSPDAQPQFALRSGATSAGGYAADEGNRVSLLWIPRRAQARGDRPTFTRRQANASQSARGVREYVGLALHARRALHAANMGWNRRTRQHSHGR